MMEKSTLRKATSLEYHHMLLLFTTPMDQVTTPEADEYLCLLQEEELNKLRRRMADLAEKKLRKRHVIKKLQKLLRRPSGPRRGGDVYANARGKDALQQSM